MVPSATPRIQVSISAFVSAWPSRFLAINAFMDVTTAPRKQPARGLWRGLEAGEGAREKIADQELLGRTAGALQNHEQLRRVLEKDLPARAAETDGLVARR